MTSPCWRVARPLAAAAVLASVALGGCTSEASQRRSDERDFGYMIDGLINEAEAGGAGEAQLELLRSAREAGVVSVDDVRTAALAMVACVEAAGSEAFIDDVTSPAGLVRPGVNSLANTPEQMDIASRCDDQEHFWIDGAFQMQPTSIAKTDAYLVRQEPVLRECLDRAGYAVDAQAGAHEVARRALEVRDQTGGSVDCLAEADITSF